MCNNKIVLHAKVPSQAGPGMSFIFTQSHSAVETGEPRDEGANGVPNRFGPSIWRNGTAAIDALVTDIHAPLFAGTDTLALHAAVRPSRRRMYDCIEAPPGGGVNLVCNAWDRRNRRRPRGAFWRAAT